MARWEPGTRYRLQATALELFGEHGFEETTVAEIAARAEVTERTFYRYFADKREVLFDGQHHFEQAFLDGVVGAPDDASPAELSAAALHSASGFFDEERRAWARARQEVIATDAGLRERELLKLAHLSGLLTTALRDRGIPDPRAGLVADSTLSVFHVAFQQWIATGESRTFPELVEDTLSHLRALALG